MTARLLERQVRLLEFLTSRDAIFGGETPSQVDPALEGFDRGLLRLEARFSYEKRMDKIARVFPKTFSLLARDSAAIVRDFIEAYPPVEMSRLDNGSEFYDFLCERWRLAPPDPPYVRDVAACELACLRSRVGVGEERKEPPQRSQSQARAPLLNAIRRCRGFVLLRCAYDNRSIFEGDGAGAGNGIVPTKRDVSLVIGVLPGDNQPQVFEVPAVAFDLLAALDDWTDAAAFATSPEVSRLIAELAEHGLVEIRR
jgi:hypothetical protein